MEDLFSVIPKDVCMDDFCHPVNYRLWELEVATPALQNLGYEDVRWMDGERDSFGPLSRVVSAVKDNAVHRFVYG